MFPQSNVILFALIYLTFETSVTLQHAVPMYALPSRLGQANPAFMRERTKNRLGINAENSKSSIGGPKILSLGSARPTYKSLDGTFQGFPLSFDYANMQYQEKLKKRLSSPTLNDRLGFETSTPEASIDQTFPHLSKQFVPFDSHLANVPPTVIGDIQPENKTNTSGQSGRFLEEQRSPNPSIGRNEMKTQDGSELDLVASTISANNQNGSTTKQVTKQLTDEEIQIIENVEKLDSVLQHFSEHSQRALFDIAIPFAVYMELKLQQKLEEQNKN